MARVSDGDPDGPSARTDEVDPPDGVEFNYGAALAVAVVVGLGLALTARTSAVALLAAVGTLQALLAFAWAIGTGLPGRKGALCIATLAASAADVTVSVWPHARLGTLLAVFGLAIPAMFIHQLMRGAARTSIVQSLGGVALLVFAEVSLPSLLQLRHEFSRQSLGGTVVAAVVAATAGALVLGYLVDLIMPAPRFDPAVPRGLLAVVASAGFGGSAGYLLLQSGHAVDFAGGRGAFAGAALGALVALLAVGAAFGERALLPPETALARRLRPVLGVLLPLSVLAPMAFLLCLAIRA
jgi:hypothetical protein